MSTYTNIPDVSFSVNFGQINKIVWFNVDDDNSIYDINFYITPNNSRDINIEIFNYMSKLTLFKKTYNKSQDTNTIIESTKIIHVPNKMGTIYGLKIS